MLGSEGCAVPHSLSNQSCLHILRLRSALKQEALDASNREWLGKI